MLIHPCHGVIFIQVKAVGDNPESRTQAEIQKRIFLGGKQLRKDHNILRWVLQDWPEVAGCHVTRVVALPNLTRDEMASFWPPADLDPASEEAKYMEGVVFLCKDDLPIPDSPTTPEADVEVTSLMAWWKEHVAGVVGALSLPFMKDMVSRYVGMLSAVEVYAGNNLRREVRLTSDAIDVCGKMFRRILLNEQQLRILSTPCQRRYLSGPPGSGKTVLLVLRARQFLRHGGHVVVVNMYRGAAGRAIGHFIRDSVASFCVPGAAGGGGGGGGGGEGKKGKAKPKAKKKKGEERVQTEATPTGTTTTSSSSSSSTTKAHSTPPTPRKATATTNTTTKNSSSSSSSSPFPRHGAKPDNISQHLPPPPPHSTTPPTTRKKPYPTHHGQQQQQQQQHYHHRFPAGGTPPMSKRKTTPGTPPTKRTKDYSPSPSHHHHHHHNHHNHHTGTLPPPTSKKTAGGQSLGGGGGGGKEALQATPTASPAPSRKRQDSAEQQDVSERVHSVDVDIDRASFDRSDFERRIRRCLPEDLATPEDVLFVVDEIYVKEYWSQVLDVLSSGFLHGCSIWCAGLYSRNPPGFQQEDLLHVLRCPPLVQKVLHAVDWVAERRSRYRLETDSSSGIYSRGLTPLAVRHQGHPQVSITECRQCAEELAALLRQCLGLPLPLPLPLPHSAQPSTSTSTTTTTTTSTTTSPSPSLSSSNRGQSLSSSSFSPSPFVPEGLAGSSVSSSSTLPGRPGSSSSSSSSLPAGGPGSSSLPAGGPGSSSLPVGGPGSLSSSSLPVEGPGSSSPPVGLGSSSSSSLLVGGPGSSSLPVGGGPGSMSSSSLPVGGPGSSSSSSSLPLGGPGSSLSSSSSSLPGRPGAGSSPPPPLPAAAAKEPCQSSEERCAQLSTSCGVPDGQSCSQTGCDRWTVPAAELAQPSSRALLHSSSRGGGDGSAGGGGEGEGVGSAQPSGGSGSGGGGDGVGFRGQPSSSSSGGGGSSSSSSSEASSGQLSGSGGEREGRGGGGGHTPTTTAGPNKKDSSEERAGSLARDSDGGGGGGGDDGKVGFTAGAATTAAAAAAVVVGSGDSDPPLSSNKNDSLTKRPTTTTTTFPTRTTATPTSTPTTTPTPTPNTTASTTTPLSCSDVVMLVNLPRDLYEPDERGFLDTTRQDFFRYMAYLAACPFTATLRQLGVPVRVVQELPCWDLHRLRDGEVSAAWAYSYQGLENKVVVYLPADTPWVPDPHDREIPAPGLCSSPREVPKAWRRTTAEDLASTSLPPPFFSSASSSSFAPSSSSSSLSSAVGGRGDDEGDVTVTVTQRGDAGALSSQCGEGLQGGHADDDVSMTQSGLSEERSERGTSSFPATAATSAVAKCEGNIREEAEVEKEGSRGSSEPSHPPQRQQEQTSGQHLHNSSPLDTTTTTTQTAHTGPSSPSSQRESTSGGGVVSGGGDGLAEDLSKMRESGPGGSDGGTSESEPGVSGGAGESGPGDSGGGTSESEPGGSGGAGESGSGPGTDLSAYWWREEDVQRYSNWDKSSLFVAGSRCLSQLIMLIP
ncbi:uncharacterized protein LOC143275715 isoform X2 [Babylonia areolata]